MKMEGAENDNSLGRMERDEWRAGMNKLNWTDREGLEIRQKLLLSHRPVCVRGSVCLS